MVRLLPNRATKTGEPIGPEVSTVSIDTHEKDPVLLSEIVGNMPATFKTLVNFTVGAGGHSMGILSTLPAITNYIGIEKDNTALIISAKNLHAFENFVQLVRGAYRHVYDLLENNGISEGDVNVCVLDVVVSSMQLNEGARGFSFKRDGLLHMRPSGDEIIMVR